MELQLFFVHKSLDVGYPLVDFPVCKHVRFSVDKKIVKTRLKDAVKASFGISVKTFEDGRLHLVGTRSDCVPRKRHPKTIFRWTKKTKHLDQMKSDLWHNKFCVLKKTDITIFSLGRTGLATTDGSTRNTTALGAFAVCQSHHLCSLPQKRNMERERGPREVELST